VTRDDQENAHSRADRSLAARIWYEVVRAITFLVFTICGGLRAGGRHHIPKTGGVLLVSNHQSHLDSFVLGIPIKRPLSFVARSTLFVPVLGPLIRSLGGFPIQREGMGASGLKETLRRLRNGSIVILFPEGTRTHDGRLGELKAGIAVIAQRARVPILPAAIAGSFEAWPRSRPIPLPHPIRVQYGPMITPEHIDGMTAEAVTSLIRTRILDCQLEARRRLDGDLGIEPIEPMSKETKA
jgi:1-acyl-sn-glycerol-3-phosphate acyltransferase